MRNPLNHTYRFALYVAAVVIGWVSTWLLTHDLVAVLGAIQTSLLVLAASRVPLDGGRHDRG